MHLTILIPAGGSGTRVGGTKKQFRLVGGQPVLVRTARAFCDWRADCALVVAVPEEDADDARRLLGELPIEPTIVAGGASRQESVRNGLRALTRSGSEDFVFIHDAVRPFVDSELLERVLAKVRQTGAAAPALEVVDTLRAVVDGRFADSVSREGLYRMQTPQAFRTNEIRRAHEMAASDRTVATDDVELYTRYVGPVALVQGSEDNIKITTPRDLETAAARWTA